MRWLTGHDDKPIVNDFNDLHVTILSFFASSPYLLLPSVVARMKSK